MEEIALQTNNQPLVQTEEELELGEIPESELGQLEMMNSQPDQEKDSESETDSFQEEYEHHKRKFYECLNGEFEERPSKRSKHG